MLPVSAAHAQSAATARGLPDFTDLVDQVGPSVVNIFTKRVISPPAEPRVESLVDRPSVLVRGQEALVPGLVKQMGGESRVESAPGMGTRWILTLRVAAPPPA